jgi:hypothetical protein
MGKGAGEAKAPDQFGCVGVAAEPNPDSQPEWDGGFWPARDLSAEEREVAMKILSCCNCAAVCKYQSNMVLYNEGVNASWQGKIFGWCQECMNCTPEQFKSWSRISWGRRANETKGKRDRAMLVNYANAADLIRSDFPDAPSSVVRELAVKRHRIMCLAFAAGTSNEPEVKNAARLMVNDSYFEGLQKAADDPTYGGSVDGRLLCARDISYFTSICDGVELCFCCRNRSCLYFGMNSQWLQLGAKYSFRCPVCFDEYKPDSTAKGQVPFAFVIAMTDLVTGKKAMVPAVWPATHDMQWLNGQIEVHALNMQTEVELDNYKNRGAADLHELLAREAVPKEFRQVPFGETGDIWRVCQQPLWNVPAFQARGFVMGNKLNPEVDDITHPYDNWGEFIAICARVVAEGRSGLKNVQQMAK